MTYAKDPRVPGEADCRERGATRTEVRKQRMSGKMPAGTRGGIFMRFALRSLRLSRARTIVSIIGIALSCALITAIFTSVTTLLDNLLAATIAREGSWQAELANIDDKQVAQLNDEKHVTERYVQGEYGSALMPWASQLTEGRYLSLLSWPDKAQTGELVHAPKIISGKAPTAPDEIVLPIGLKGQSVESISSIQGEAQGLGLPTTGKDDNAPTLTWDGTLAEGSAISVPLGQRSYLDENGATRPMRATESLFILYEDENGNGEVREWLDGIQPARTLTVTGFYESTTMDWSSSAGVLGLVSPDSNLPRQTSNAFFATDFTSYNDLRGLISSYTGKTEDIWSGVGSPDLSSNTAGITHDSLIRYQGLTDDRAIWGTLYQMAAILAVVVLVASVSLIYNSFAIAVSERTRQYGLLSSLGASRRQLRRTVYAEALMLAAAGIPLGLALGLVGTWVVFQIGGDGLGALVDQDLYAGTGITQIIVSPSVLALSAAIALVTVLVSAAVPALRASRVSAVDALRQSRDVRISRRDRARQRKLSRLGGHGQIAAARAPFLDRLRLHMGGIPGFIAHRNLTRAASKGRVAVASLAVSVALLITSGSISMYLGRVVTAVDDNSPDIGINITRQLGADETVADGIDALNALLDKLAATPGTTAASYDVGLGALMHAGRDVMSSDIDGDLEDDAGTTLSDYVTDVEGGQIVSTSGAPTGAVTKDGDVYVAANLVFVDGASWKRLTKVAGVDEATGTDDGSPVALAANGISYSRNSQYATRSPFAGAGNAELLTDVQAGEHDYLMGVALDKDGKVCAAYQTYDENLNLTGIDDPGDPLYGLTLRPLDNVVHERRSIRVAGTIDMADIPSGMLQIYSDIPSLILPVTALESLAVRTADMPETTESYSPMGQPFAIKNVGADAGNDLIASYNIMSNDAAVTEAAVENVLDESASGTPWDHSYVTNNAQNRQSNLLAFQTVQLLINCFVIITGAIAVANVFNTLSSSIILRRREFAVLQSAGMGPAAFRRMIAFECGSYAWRGLAIGLVLATGVAYLLWQSMQYSFYGMEFTLPWTWVAGAVAVVLGVLLLSVVYALRKSRADSIVEALREDGL